LQKGGYLYTNPCKLDRQKSVPAACQSRKATAVELSLYKGA